MTPAIPDGLEQQILRLDELSAWERTELGRALRRSGWTYREIGALIPAAKSTIAGWCRDIDLTPEQEAAIRDRTGSRRGIPRDTQRKRRNERERLHREAMAAVCTLAHDSDWLGGTVLYWAEGFKTENAIGMANSDPELLRAFMSWCTAYHDADASFSIKLNLHEGNDEAAAIDFWAQMLGLTAHDFRKTYIKPDGTGHRRNHLRHGVAQVRMRRSTDAFVVTTGWIEGLRGNWRLCGPIA